MALYKYDNDDDDFYYYYYYYFYYFLDPGTQFQGNEKITPCNTKSTKIKL